MRLFAFISSDRVCSLSIHSHPDLATDQAKNGFHNYLDEFRAFSLFPCPGTQKLILRPYSLGYQSLWLPRKACKTTLATVSDDSDLLSCPQVFHELARHLQTRRLVAGDTLDLSKDKSFYIVVDGQVEVYARNPSSGAPGQNVSTEDYDTEDEEEGNGWQLLNNVESGGTLSSLFTILSLFTEDVKLRYEEDKGGHYDSSDDDFSGGRANASSRDEDVTALHLDQDGTPGRAPFIGLNEAPAHRISETEDADDEGAETTERERDHDGDESGQLSSLDTMLSPSDSRSTSTTPGLRSPASDYGFSRPSPAPPSTNGTSVSANPTSPTLSATSRTSRRGSLAQPMLSRRSSTHRPSALPSRPSLTTRHPPYASSKSGTKRSARSTRTGGGLAGAKHAEGAGAGLGGRAQEATIARAATDTTLAVIPAEAFRRLTKKFPNAAA